MATTLTDNINVYLTNGHRATVYGLDDEFCIIENPSFDILPNHPYVMPFVVALFCHGGCARGRVNTITYDISPNTFFIVLPNQISELIDISEDFEATYVIMSERFTESLNVANSFSMRNIIVMRPLIALGAREYEALDGYFKLCRSIIPVESNPHRLEILSLVTRAFFLGLGYFLHEQSDHRKSRQEELTEEFIALVERYYRENRSLAFYAQLMGLTSKHISTVVKQTSGRSAQEWIERYVMLDAITQLASTERTIKQIAYDLNFPSQSFFGKYFARVVGISPQAYRAKHRR